jgi:hypothetical protein
VKSFTSSITCLSMPGIETATTNASFASLTTAADALVRRVKHEDRGVLPKLA